MNKWANVGDLVYVLGRDNEVVPCKIIKEIGTGANTQLFFETITDEDKQKIPKNRLKCFLPQAGYLGGFVFKERQNALDYLDTINQRGGFNMSSIINKKAKRAQEKQLGKTHGFDIEKVKHDAATEAITKVEQVLVSAILLAMNSKLGIGPKRAAEVIDEMNRLVDEVGSGNLTQEELNKMAENKMKFKRKS